MRKENPLKVHMTMDQLIAEAAKTAPVGTRDVTVPEVRDGETQISLFQKSEIRKICRDGEWWYSVADVVRALIQSNDEGAWRKIKSKLKQEGSEVVADCDELKMPGKDGKLYATDCANVETLFRIIQAIPSPKAEPFKKWLARVGYERIQEYQNPEISIKRAIASYRAMGRDDDWIKNRLQTVISRNELTDEWQQRGIQEGKEYAILTDTISQGTFGKTTAQHKEYKGLGKGHGLRDHMTGLELVLTMLGEEATKEIAIRSDAQGFWQNREAAKAGGTAAGEARKSIEKQTGKLVLSRQNFLPKKQDQGLLE